MMWRSRAACRGLPASWFITSDPYSNNPHAKAVCDHCPVEDDCLLDAIAIERRLELKDALGIRGGLTPLERIELARTLPIDISTKQSTTCGSIDSQPSAHTTTSDRERRTA